MLRLFAENEGKLLTHRMILREVWGPAYQTESNYLHVYVSHLRRKLERDPTRPRYILTEPGAGYRFVVPEACKTGLRPAVLLTDRFSRLDLGLKRGPQRHAWAQKGQKVTTRTINRILVATDGSDSAQHAVELGVELAAAEDAEVAFLHVVPPIEFLAGRLSLPAVPRRLSATDDEVLERAAAVARANDVPFHLELIAGEIGESSSPAPTRSTPT